MKRINILLEPFHLDEMKDDKSSEMSRQLFNFYKKIRVETDMLEVDRGLHSESI